MSSRIRAAVQRTRCLSLVSFHSSEFSQFSLLVEEKRFWVKKQTRAAERDAVIGAAVMSLPGFTGAITRDTLGGIQFGRPQGGRVLFDFEPVLF